jgi:hypothetical protein
MTVPISPVFAVLLFPPQIYQRTKSRSARKSWAADSSAIRMTATVVADPSLLLAVRPTRIAKNPHIVW